MVPAARLRTPLNHRVSWLSRESWLHVVRSWLLSPAGVAGRKALVVSERAVLAVAADDAAHADHRTGANVKTSHERVGRRIGYSWKVVQRARRVLERAALARSVETGRYLTNEERERTGHLKMASRRQLAVPRHLTVHLPRSVGPRVKSYVPEPKTRRARGARRPRTIEMQRFARDLGELLPYLSPRDPHSELPVRHIGRVCSALEAAGVDPLRWTPLDLKTEMDAWHAERGQKTLAHGAHSPEAWLRWAASQVAGKPGPTLTERKRAAAAEAERNLSRHLAERAAAAAEAATPRPVSRWSSMARAAAHAGAAAIRQKDREWGRH